MVKTKTKTSHFYAISRFNARSELLIWSLAECNSQPE